MFAPPDLSVAPWLAVTVVSAGIGLLVWLVRRQVWRGARTRYPLVLAHGLMGFGEIGIGSMKQEYFKGVATHLETLGLEVHRPTVPAAGTIARRAEVLAEKIRALPAKRVNIIAHSMGGLDARWAVARLGLHDKVASVTTIGTPHHGTPLADLSTTLLKATVRVARLWKSSSGMFEAFADLGVERMSKFNADAKNVPGVAYMSIVATVPPGSKKLHGFLGPSHKWLASREGANDGIVTASSQRWGKILTRVKADHWAQIGWSSRFDAPAFYERVARKLRARGL